MRGGTRKGSGRKAIQIDLVKLENLCAIGCTDEELAAAFGVSVRTIETRGKNAEFAETKNRGKARMRISLRRWQMKSAEKGNPTTLIWLGKQTLGQRDVRPIELSGPDGKPVKISWEVLDAIVGDAD